MENLSFATKSIEFIAAFLYATNMGFNPTDNEATLDASMDNTSLEVIPENHASEEIYNAQSGINVADMANMLDAQQGDEYDLIFERVIESYDTEQEKLYFFNNGKQPNDPEFREDFLVTNDHQLHEQNLHADNLIGWSGTQHHMAHYAAADYRLEVEAKLGAKASQEDWNCSGAGFYDDEICNLNGPVYCSTSRSWRQQYVNMITVLNFIWNSKGNQKRLYAGWKKFNTRRANEGNEFMSNIGIARCFLMFRTVGIGTDKNEEIARNTIARWKKFKSTRRVQHQEFLTEQQEIFAQQLVDETEEEQLYLYE